VRFFTPTQSHSHKNVSQSLIPVLALLASSLCFLPMVLKIKPGQKKKIKILQDLLFTAFKNQ
jgi:hypothetical protein